MADLIDRAVLIEMFTPLFYNASDIEAEAVIEKIKIAPAVDAVEVKHGHWQEYEDYCLDVYYDCSVCGGSFYMADGTPTENGYNYCPKCGARLDGTIRIEVEDDATD